MTIDSANAITAYLIKISILNFNSSKFFDLLFDFCSSHERETNSNSVFDIQKLKKVEEK